MESMVKSLSALVGRQYREWFITDLVPAQVCHSQSSFTGMYMNVCGFVTFCFCFLFAFGVFLEGNGSTDYNTLSLLGSGAIVYFRFPIKVINVLWMLSVINPILGWSSQT